MKTSFILAASLSAILVTASCQKSSPPAADQSRAAPPQTNGSAVDLQEQPKPIDPATDSKADADQPDDPGMTTAHDKTVKQEKPSGDESSNAGPNEGDAEPPQ